MAGYDDQDPTEATPSASIMEFDPSPYLRRLRGPGGGQEYLDVRHRLLWLRREHPDAEIVTEHIRIDDQHAIFRAAVSIPGGGSATGHGSETAADFGDYIEKAETKALGRALNALGYGAQFAEGDEGTVTVQDRPPGRARVDRLPVPSTPPATTEKAKAPGAVQPPLEDYSWTAFWSWARSLGFNKLDDIAVYTGTSVEGLSPGKVRALIMQRKSEEPTS